MGATRLASGNYAAIIVVAFVFNFYLYPDAGRVAPISACVWCNTLQGKSIITCFGLLPDSKTSQKKGCMQFVMHTALIYSTKLSANLVGEFWSCTEILVTRIVKVGRV